jgi:Ca2+-binding RTX toxin-like protein
VDAVEGSPETPPPTGPVNSVPESLTLEPGALEVGRIRVGDELRIGGTFFDADLDDMHGVDVDWGDGTVETLTLEQAAGGGRYHGGHAYLQGGIYEVQVTITDDAGDSVTDRIEVTVSGMRVHDGILEIVGSPGRDEIEFDRRGQDLVVEARLEDGRLDGGVREEFGRYDIRELNSVVVLLGGDDDAVAVVSSAVTNTISMNGGEGYDTFYSQRPVELTDNGFRVRGTKITGVNFEGLTGVTEIVGSDNGDNIAIYNDRVDIDGSTLLLGDWGNLTIRLGAGDDQFGVFVEGGLPANTRPEITIVDAGGDDTYVVAGARFAIDLRDAAGTDTLDFSGLSSSLTLKLSRDNGERQTLGSSLVRVGLTGTFENVIATPYNDTVFGNVARNTLQGGAGRDRLWGGDGGDLLYGDADRDRLFGEAGDDTLDGGEGTDLLRGGRGDDVLLSGTGRDILLGHAGNDILAVPDGDLSNRHLDGGKGTDTLRLDTGDATLDLRRQKNRSTLSIEQIDLRGSGDNRLTLDYQGVRRLSPSRNTLVVRRNQGDVVDIGSGWIQQPDEIHFGTRFEVFRQRSAVLKIEAVDAALVGSAATHRYPIDVNRDGHITPVDALLVINCLNGADPNGPLWDGTDVTDDGVLSPIDVLTIIHHFNSPPTNTGPEGESPQAPRSDLATSATETDDVLGQRGKSVLNSNSRKIVDHAFASCRFGTPLDNQARWRVRMPGDLTSERDWFNVDGAFGKLDGILDNIVGTSQVDSPSDWK